MRASLLVILVVAILGCLAPSRDAVTSVGDGAPTPALARTFFAFDGRIAVGATACPVVTCVDANPDHDRWRPLEFEGVLTGVDLTMTWEASTPSMREMRLGVGWRNGEQKEYVDGESPLTLRLEGLRIDPSDEPVVWALADTAVMELVGATTPQDFHVEGEIVTLPP